jgi:hypothetical protein
MALFGEFSKRHKKFFEILLKSDYNSKELALLVGHVCWKNYEMSRRIGKNLIISLNKVGAKDLEASLEVVQVYLTIEDEF